MEPRSRSTSAAAATELSVSSEVVREPVVTCEGGARRWTDGRSGFRVVGGDGRGTVERNGSKREGSGRSGVTRRKRGKELMEASQQIHFATHFVHG